MHNNEIGIAVRFLKKKVLAYLPSFLEKGQPGKNEVTEQTK